MKYLKKFETHEDYEEYVTGGTMVKPNVSYCEDFDDVHYNPWTWADAYFTIEALEDGDIKFVFGSGVTINDMTSMSYSTDGGKNWILIENNNGKTSDLETTVSVNSGDKILFKGIGNTMCHIENGTMPMPPFGKMSHFESTIEVNVMGNIMSLVFGDDYKNQYSLENRPYCFAYLYNVQGKMLNIISAENLILPATTLASFCYQYMFYGCTSLTTAPELPATTLASYCYRQMFQGCTSLTSAPTLPAITLADKCYYGMFQGCTNLNYIKAMFTTTPSTTYTSNWVSNVAASGTYVKNSAASYTTRGASAIPNGWTVETASA